MILALIFFLKRPGEGVLQAVPLGIVALMEHDHGFLFHGISVDQHQASSVRFIRWIKNDPSSSGRAAVANNPNCDTNEPFLH